MGKIQAIANAVWDALHKYQVPPTPRNFEVWYAYCSEDKPRLRQRIDRLIDAKEPFTPGVMDSLYEDFFDSLSVGSAEGARELRHIAADLVERITTSRVPIGDYNSALNECSTIFDALPSPGVLQQVTTALRTATREINGRMSALEQLFTASLVRISELHETLARTEKDATSDPLTGLANRRAFNAALLQAITQAAADGTDVALLLLDIDHFKKFNDVYGHTLGDNALCLVARVLTRHIKGRDTVARYGGEEFAIVLQEASQAAAMTVAEQIRTLLGNSPLMNRKTGQSLGAVTCSIGVSVYRPMEAPGDLVDRADKALYRAKQSGRNRVCADS